MKKTIKQSFDTLGIVADLNIANDLHLLKQFANETGGEKLYQFIEQAQVLDKRFLVAAGHFGDKGFFATLCDDETQLLIAFEMANAKMDEVGSRTTAWIYLPESCRKLLKSFIRVNDNIGGVR